MNRDDVVRLALEAGISPPKEVHEFWICEPADLERFAALVADAAREREECATHPPRREPLTDEEIRDLWSWSMTAAAERTATTQWHAFARAIERAHGIGGDE